MKTALLSCSLVVLFVPVLSAQTDVSADLETIRDDYNLPGLSALAVRDGQIIAYGAAGVRRFLWSAPLTVEDRINLGSCSKWFAAVVAGRLVDAGVITWETRVSDLFDNYLDFDPAFQDATLEDFLMHRSGAQASPAFLAEHWDDLKLQTGTVTELRRWVSEAVLSDPPAVTPGDYLYANQGYAVVGTMLELASGKDYATLIREELFEPLRMTSSGLGIVHGESPPTAPSGHTLASGAAFPEVFYPPNQATYRCQRAAYEVAGFIGCSLADWAKFVHAMMTGDQSDFLSAASWQRIQTPGGGSEGYGLGIGVWSRWWADPGPALAHTGEYWGHFTTIWAAPAHDLIMLSFTNCDTEGDEAFLATDSAIGVLLGHKDAPLAGSWLETPEVVSIARDGAFSFEFTTLPGVSYRVEAAPDLESPWAALNGDDGEVAGSQVREWAETGTIGQQFFRVQAVVPGAE